MVAVVFGNVPRAVAPLQQAMDGEAYAALMLTRFSMPPITVHIDCKGTIAAVKTPLKAAQPQNPRAHTWSRYLAAFVGESVEVKKRRPTQRRKM